MTQPYIDVFPAHCGNCFVVVGDTQRTDISERLVGREQNDAERLAIVQAIAAEKPAFVVHLGDMVVWGSRRSNWRYFDGLMQPLHAAGVPLLPLLGNHDYWARPERALGFMHDRFPQLRSASWYERQVGPLALVCLDSNPRILGQERWREQVAWFEQTLHRLDATSAIRGVLVLTHHPPFSNSRGHRESTSVRNDFVPAFLGAHKTLAMISGHAHTYERFLQSGKQLIVAGGGGGPRVALRPAHQRKYVDQFSGPVLRPFHYLLAEIGETGIHLQVKGIEKGSVELRLLEVTHLPFT